MKKQNETRRINYIPFPAYHQYLHKRQKIQKFQLEFQYTRSLGSHVSHGKTLNSFATSPTIVRATQVAAQRELDTEYLRELSSFNDHSWERGESGEGVCRKAE